MGLTFNKFKKNLKKQQERQKVTELLNSQISAYKKRREEYVDLAKAELKKGNKAQYSAYVALLKYTIFNLSQTESMLANFTIANEMCEMQNLSKKFTKSLDSVLKDVYKVSASVNASKTQELFTKAVEKANKTSLELKDVLKENNATFVDSVNSLADISDEEVDKLLKVDMNADGKIIDDALSGLEAEFLSADKENG